MRGKIIVSACVVIGLLTLAVVALISTAQYTPADSISDQSIAEEPFETAVSGPAPEQTATEELETAEEPEATEEPEQTAAYAMEWDEEESYLLAKIAMAEAEGEDTEGKALVVLVVLNRVASDEFPDTIWEVIYQQGQFSPISNGRFDRVEPNEDCWLALNMIRSEHWDESQGAMYFESKSESTWHEDNLKFLFRHGGHYFYTDKE